MALAFESVSPSVFGPKPQAGWCLSGAKRAFDLACGALLLTLSLPVMALTAVLIALTSPGPVLFRHTRLGKDGSEIAVLKFRTMLPGSVAGPCVTREGDHRITRLGRLLRRWKIDELPQLINVVRGDMSLVGPRPDVARYFARVAEEDRRVLALKPGITSPATLVFRDEEKLLGRVPLQDVEDFYCRTLLPHKIRLELDYAAKASFSADVKLLLRTAAAVLRLRSPQRNTGSETALPWN